MGTAAAPQQDQQNQTTISRADALRDMIAKGDAVGITEQGLDDLINRFTYHPPIGDQKDRYEYLRAKAFDFALDIIDCVPDSRERAIALTHLETACFYANAGIARNEQPTA